MLRSANNAARLRADELRIKTADRPGWVTGAERMPTAGETVFCTGGPAEVVRLLGKTGDGSRLLELRLEGSKQPPFFVAASNVLLPP